MIIAPDILHHPKFRRLERRLRNAALYVLVRIWAHCQITTRDEVWEGVDDEYVEMVAEWGGEPGKCVAALLELGWLGRIEGGFVVIGWNEQNAALRTSWRNGGKGGRASASRSKGEKTHGLPPGSPPVTHGLPPGSPPVAHGITDRIGEDRSREDNPPVAPQGGASEGEPVPIPSPPVMVPEAAARSWMQAAIAQGATFTEADFQEAWNLLHGTRDVRTGAWRVGRNGVVSDPRVILSQRLHDAQERRLGRSGQGKPASIGAQAFVLRQKIDAQEAALKEHKGCPTGVWPEHVRNAHAADYRERLKALTATKNQLLAIAHEQPA